MRTFLILSICCVGHCASILFVGDSTARYLYHDALIQHCDVAVQTYVDFASIVPKNPEYKTFSGYETFASASCKSGSKYHGIGYFLHWGVFPQPYHTGWETHKINGYPGEELPDLNTTLSIQTALQTWTAMNKGSKIIVFYSNLWDTLRYLDIFKTTKTYEDHMKEYNIAFESMLNNAIFPFVDKKTTLILQTTQIPRDDDKKVLTIIHNHIIRNIASRHGLKLLDVDEMLYGSNSKMYLLDSTHQNQQTSKNIVLLLDSILNNRQDRRIRSRSSEIPHHIK